MTPEEEEALRNAQADWMIHGLTTESVPVIREQSTLSFPMAVIESSPDTPDDSEDVASPGGGGNTFEKKIVQHLGAPAEQGFAVDGPPEPL